MCYVNKKLINYFVRIIIERNLKFSLNKKLNKLFLFNFLFINFILDLFKSHDPIFTSEILTSQIH